MTLQSLLHSTFGFPGFRGNQEAVCRAATDGRDVLLVMPTGAGKSLCYQLPAIARGGPALVISPLIALMEDQASKLSRLGLRVARIHSGLSRDDARQACRDYLDGTLQFLFIAPERMRVPGFPQMLAKRIPSLIAIDEAHCISAWGHDFRPDYRTLGEHLPALRPAPIIALTATATPTVQRDIATQLQLRDPALFIHGFRRSNLAIEVVEMSRPRRNGFAGKLLNDPAHRPAIVYAPSRKAAEDLAGELAHRFPAAAYHAGLEPSTRERVQTAFLSGELEVVVATIAFGMGIDKPNVRTVLHTALPASIEAFYQEIGRAGRDGLPSRTVLLHSFADRKMHEFFLDRDYPPTSDIARVAATLTDDFESPEHLARRLKMDPTQFQKSIEKLIAQGASAIDVSGNVRRTASTDTQRAAAWRSGYEAQVAFRRAQIDSMAAFAETPQCRMAALVRHFGDTSDGSRACGHCDICSPQATQAQTFREPTATEARAMRAILAALQHAPSKAAGKLHKDLGLTIERREFDTLLDALARAGYLTISAEMFTNAEGRSLPYKKLILTHEGRADDASELIGVLIPDDDSEDAPPSRKSRRDRNSKNDRSSKKKSDAPEVSLTPAQQLLEATLRAWRKEEAAKAKKPAFIVFADSVLRAIAATSPRTIAELLAIPGVGRAKADTYGAAVLRICRGDTPAESTPAPRAASSAAAKPASSPIRRETAPPRQTSFLPTAPAEQPAKKPKEPRPVINVPDVTYTAEQQALDIRLRDWRRTESERLGVPQFFILSTSSLRNIVLQRPPDVSTLGTVDGLDREKLRQFGEAIVQLCNA